MQMKLVEAGCILVLATLGLSTLNQQKIMAADGHGFVLQSLLRPQIRRHTPLLDTSGAPGSLSHSNFLLKEIVDAAIKFFFKLGRVWGGGGGGREGEEEGDVSDRGLFGAFEGLGLR